MGMPGRQAYFKEFILQAMSSYWTGDVAVEDLYVAAGARAEPSWIDDEPCPHGSSQPEWQHELRWSLLKLKADGAVESVRRGVYRLT